MSSATPSLLNLLAQTSLDDPEEVLKAANAVLRRSKNDLEAQHVKVVALLKQDRFDDAIRIFEDAGDQLKEKATLEYAYALYKTGNLEEAERATQVQDGDPERARGLLHVQAQTAYRLESFSKAAEIYAKLSGKAAAVHGEVNDLKINTGAVSAQLEWAGEGHLVKDKKVVREDLEAFETAYNAACGSIARGEMAQSEVLLRRAKDLCNALEDLTDDEKKAETLPIIVQQIYVLSRLGKLEEAGKLSSSIQIPDVPDLSTRHIAQVNSLVASTGSDNPYLSHRLFNSSQTLPKTDKLFNIQASILRQDAHILDLLSLKYNGLAKSTSAYISQQPSPTISADVNSISVLNAAAHARSEVGKAGLKQILPLLEERPNDVGLIFTIIQLYILTNNHASAISLLESFFSRLDSSCSATELDVRYAPGLVGILISLYTLQNRKSHIKPQLTKAASYWRHKSKTPPPNLLKAAGAALLESSDLEDLAAAGEFFETLHNVNPTDKSTLAGLVAAYATTAPQKLTRAHYDALTPIQKLIPTIDAEALEAAGIARPPQSSQPAIKKRAPEKEKERARKIKRSRMPKDFVEGRKMDEERWLPMRDRSYYRPKGKKGKKRAEGATQGGVSEEKEKVEGKPVVQAAGGSQGQKSKKKKGKGGKW
ncbi:hypothetical protein M501DRAFT_990341 [Patellaria atrata CBS 101060]|uniref:Signal recognition particle subunit SRP72 n=1 Tax=Patellaria atrata CBS 101060 TaxID=1346257 RepID=A0A9P4S1E4_9PEZI|nr:hypothetical protein M501DRAFT_990341 [Patellaria atrata CBS 101060]